MINYPRTRLCTMVLSHAVTVYHAHAPQTKKMIVVASLCAAMVACSGESANSGSTGTVPPSPSGLANSIGEAEVAATQPLIAFDDGQAGGEQPVSEVPVSTEEPPVFSVGNCIDCSSRQVSLDWSAAADTDIGYFVYYGTNPDNVSVLATSITLDNPAVSDEVFSVSLSAGADLGLESGSPVCFSVSALNTLGETDRSNPVCQTL